VDQAQFSRINLRLYRLAVFMGDQVMVIVTPAEVTIPVTVHGKKYAIGTGTHEVDFVVLTSINYALARVGIPVVQFQETLDLRGQTEVAICGHGGIGTIEGLPASKFANLLADPSRGCRDTLEKLVLTCCYAGVRKNNDREVGTAVIDVLAETLKIKDLRIQGALGPSIKTNVLGEAFRVVNAAKVDQASTIQAEVMQEAGVQLAKEGKTTKKGGNPLYDPTTGWNRKMSWEKIQDKMGDRSKDKEGLNYIEYKAKKYSDLSADFFRNFEQRLQQAGVLLDAHHNMRTVYWDGSKVVTEAPPKGKSWCYITTATVTALGLPDDCDELTLLRRFRDEVLLATPSGRREVEAYYATAPTIVAAINRLGDSQAVYRHLFHHRIAPAVAAVRAGRHADAYAIYRRLVEEAGHRYR
jgi:hypothetical protein